MNNHDSSVKVIDYAWGWTDSRGATVRGTIENTSAADMPCSGIFFTLVGNERTYSPEMSSASYCSNNVYAPNTRGLFFMHFGGFIQRGHYTLRFQHFGGNDTGTFANVSVDIGNK